MPSQEIRAVFFDAVGTLIHPDPSAAIVYAEAGRRFGSRLDAKSISRRFRHFFQIEEEADFSAGLATNEERELSRWQNIVAGALDDVSDPAACFTHLYDHFGKPAAWHCDPAAQPLFENLRKRGLKIGLASNYDHRLRSVAAGLPPLRSLDHMIISAEIGWRKPAPQFFEALCRAVDLPAEAILYVGDDPANDYEGAIKAGLQAILLDPRDQFSAMARLCQLDDLIKLV